MIMYHDVIAEYFGSLYNTVFEDHTWQDEESEAYINSRKERMPVMGEPSKYVEYNMKPCSGSVFETTKPFNIYFNGHK